MVCILLDLKPRRVPYFQLLARSTEMNARQRSRRSLPLGVGRLSLVVMSIAFLFGADSFGQAVSKRFDLLPAIGLGHANQKIIWPV